MKELVQFLLYPFVRIMVYLDFTDYTKFPEFAVKFIKSFGYKLDDTSYSFCDTICIIDEREK